MEPHGNTHLSRSQSPSPVMAQRGVMPKVQSQPSLPASDTQRSSRTSSSSSMNSSRTSSRSTSPTRSPESLIQKILRKIKNEEPFFSLEFFPPRTATGAVNLISRYGWIAVVPYTREKSVADLIEWLPGVHCSATSPGTRRGTQAGIVSAVQWWSRMQRSTTAAWRPCYTWRAPTARKMKSPHICIKQRAKGLKIF